jgi:hypothetical protein
MLTLDADSLLEIVQALRRYHINPGITPPLVQGMTYADGQSRYRAVNIPYGLYGDVVGTVQLTIDQFELTGSSRVTGGSIQPFTSYQHSAEFNNKQSNYNAALLNPNLNSSPQNKSAIINMISECSRSTFVLDAITTLLSSYVTIPDKAWMGLAYAFKHYSATCDFIGYGILAGNQAWQPLIYNDYQNYVNDLPANTNKAFYLEQLQAVNTYVQNNRQTG